MPGEALRFCPAPALGAEGRWFESKQLIGLALNLPDFDPFYSAASWYRDYVAYCGVSDNGEKLYAVVAQLGRKKPVLHKDLGPAHGGDMPDSECPAPVWQRQPARVLFAPIGGQKLTFAVRGHAAGLATEPEPVEEQPIRN